VSGADPQAAELVRGLTERGQTVAVAESLTGGLLGAAITSVPGASVVFRGGVVAYATDLKAALLGVDPALLTRVGAVHEQVAAQMAVGVRERLDATWGVATTGAAGPDPQDGRPPGTVCLAVAGPSGEHSALLRLTGDRESVRAATVGAALAMLAAALADPDGNTGEQDD
jgi:nicotinamide-nucleotide amidase